jgi:lipid A 4'-phosphatase
MNLLHRHFWKLLFAACALVFVLAPGIDLAVSHGFYRAGEGFFLKPTALPQLSYRAVNEIEMPLVIGLVVAFLASCTVLRRRMAAHRAPLGLLLLSLLLGPGLAVNAVLKEHIGRARPDRVVEFGGTQQFTPALMPADQCAENCSFVSGHAALGFYPVTVGFAYPRRRRGWLIAGLLLGTFTGGMRVIQGKHFLSDIVFAFFVVYGVAAALAWGFRRAGWLPDNERSDRSSPAPSLDATLKLIN